MGIFSKNNDTLSVPQAHAPDVKLTKDDQFKFRSTSIHDPVLEAVQEAQPFEQAADTSQDDPNRQSYYSGEHEGDHPRDVFGQPIHQPDVSNPTRARDERPLDTIRGFEYAISGDPSWGQRLETHQYGFRVRPDFPQFGNVDPHAMNASQQGYLQDQAVYTAPAPNAMSEGGKKKKRGLFGRKKK
ncbi:LADA_0B01508g1_1 [Lachancea dasiensis]|uniref:LADA_0B01508g1_1 n=1 Tax=Lachancea dasiensis TaxID=1072105 RepID=A0A1G4ISG1_9SACH|nr:LADA_0B01508g1_1 [Lachancea dasiensis]